MNFSDAIDLALLDYSFRTHVTMKIKWNDSIKLETIKKLDKCIALCKSIRREP